MNVKPRERKKIRIRKKVSGNQVRPRLTVYKSLTAIYAQLIDDLAGNTLCSASIKTKNIDGAQKLGALLAEKAKEKSISKVVFDRNGYAYHGVVKKLAESVRENGIEI